MWSKSEGESERQYIGHDMKSKQGWRIETIRVVQGAFAH
jgi:hypothetical protein